MSLKMWYGFELTFYDLASVTLVVKQLCTPGIHVNLVSKGQVVLVQVVSMHLHKYVLGAGRKKYRACWVLKVIIIFSPTSAVWLLGC